MAYTYALGFDNVDECGVIETTRIEEARLLAAARPPKTLKTTCI